MQTAAIYIKTDREVKAKAQQVAKELGLSLSALVNAWLRQLIRTKTITFSALPEKPNKQLISTMKQAEKDYNIGSASPTFKTGEEAVAWLEKQGV